MKKNAAGNIKSIEPVFSVVETRKWLISQLLLPLTDNIDDKPEAATVINQYFKEKDSRIRSRLMLRTGDKNCPCLRIMNPHRNFLMHNNEEKEFSTILENVGNQELKISRVRSKAPKWLRVVKAPKAIPPGKKAKIDFKLKVKNGGRNLRCEYTIITNDTKHKVARGFINATVKGEIPAMTKVKQLFKDLVIINSGILPAGKGKTGTETPSPLPVTEPLPKDKVIIEFFYSKDCGECPEIKKLVLPEVKEVLGDKVKIVQYDISNNLEYLKLMIKLEEKLRVKTDESVIIFINRKITLCGLREIREKLLETATSEVK